MECIVFGLSGSEALEGARSQASTQLSVGFLYSLSTLNPKPYPQGFGVEEMTVWASGLKPTTPKITPKPYKPYITPYNPYTPYNP